MLHPHRVPGIPPCPGGCRKCGALGWRARENDQPHAEAAIAGHKAPATGGRRYRPPLRRSDTGERRQRCCVRACSRSHLSRTALDKDRVRIWHSPGKITTNVTVFHKGHNRARARKSRSLSPRGKSSQEVWPSEGEGRFSTLAQT